MRNCLCRPFSPSAVVPASPVGASKPEFLLWAEGTPGVPDTWSLNVAFALPAVKAETEGKLMALTSWTCTTVKTTMPLAEPFQSPARWPQTSTTSSTGSEDCRARTGFGRPGPACYFHDLILGPVALPSRCQDTIKHVRREVPCLDRCSWGRLECHGNSLGHILLHCTQSRQ